MLFASGNTIRAGVTGQTVDRVPAGYWIIKLDPMSGYYLEKINAFDIPEKIYGDIEDRAQKAINSFRKWDGNLGVLMSGYKGTGKTLLAKRACIQCVEEGIPVICMTQAYSGADFISFLNEIQHPCVMLIDEFEKIFQVKDEDDGGAQNTVLGLLDGAINSKFLFLLTINEEQKMSKFLLNRPGRIHYKWDFKGMSDDMIEEVALDNLKDKKHLNDILRISTYVGDMSMDILLSIIREVNEYPGQSVDKLLEDMNLQQDTTAYKVSIYLDGQLYAKYTEYEESPYDEDIYLEWYRGQIRSKFVREKNGQLRCLNTNTDSEKQKELEEQMGKLMEERNGPVSFNYITELSFNRKDAEVSRDEKGKIHFVLKEEMQTHEGIRPVEWEVVFEKSKYKYAGNPYLL